MKKQTLNFLLKLPQPMLLHCTVATTTYRRHILRHVDEVHHVHSLRASSRARGLGFFCWGEGVGGGKRMRMNLILFPHPLPPTKTQAPSSRACSQATTCKAGQTPRCQISTYNGFNRGKLESLFFSVRRGK